MIGEMVILFIGYKVYRAFANDPGYQMQRAREAILQKQQSEIGSSRMNCHERRMARVEDLQARTWAANAVEAAVKDLHAASRDGLRRIHGTETSLNKQRKQQKG